jgi:hypothetical protein
LLKFAFKEAGEKKEKWPIYDAPARSAVVFTPPCGVESLGRLQKILRARQGGTNLFRPHYMRHFTNIGDSLNLKR